MREITTRLIGIVSALAIAAALIFGTTQALLAGEDCPNDGWNSLGACVDYDHCWGMCNTVHQGNFIDADCDMGCCWCIL